ncbi:MAG TPA: GNAT family N-acetyltransferase [Parvibaculum sp.]
MQEIVRTERLRLRHFEPDDAADIQKLANNWNVARMLGRMPYPYPDGAAAQWIATHDRARADGSSYPLAVEFDGGLVGSVGLHVQDNGDHELGYWIGEPYWNRGFATEAAGALIDYAFDTLGLPGLVAGHFAENHASGRVLTKLGFRYTDEGYRWCEARQRTLISLAMKRERQAEARVAAKVAVGSRR